MAINNIGANNEARDRLIAQLRGDRLIGCTGAGLSAWAGYRLWRGVIDRLAAEVERRRPGEVNTQLIVQNHQADLLLCARRLGSDLGEAAFAEFIRAEFGPTSNPPHEVLLRIAALPLRHAITLNFDTSFEAAHPIIGATCQTISSCDRPALACFLRDMDTPQYPKHAVHLHGKYDDPIGQIALAEDRYDFLYRRDPFFRNFVWSMGTKRLLFIGLGFTDYDFTNILRDCARDVRGNGLNHFGFVGIRPEENDDQRRAFLNERFLLDPVFYNVTIETDGQESHAEFAALINGISATLGMPEPVVARPQVVEPVPVAPLDANDERRAEELTQRLLDRIEPGGGRV